jgi:hypothetical protein
MVTCMNVQDMLDDNLKLYDKPILFVNVLDFYFRESCKWWCSNILLCCLPLAACTAFDALSTCISGPYYEIEVWKQIEVQRI